MTTEPFQFRATPAPTHSPWGKPDFVREIAPGIWSVWTPSHGGYRVSAERLAAMPAALREFQTFNNNDGWYEEDCDWAIVCVAYPVEFCAHAIRWHMNTLSTTVVIAAINTIRSICKDKRVLTWLDRNQEELLAEVEGSLAKT